MLELKTKSEDYGCGINAGNSIPDYCNGYSRTYYCGNGYGSGDGYSYGESYHFHYRMNFKLNSCLGNGVEDSINEFASAYDYGYGCGQGLSNGIIESLWGNDLTFGCGEDENYGNGKGDNYICYKSINDWLFRGGFSNPWSDAFCYNRRTNIWNDTVRRILNVIQENYEWEVREFEKNKT